MTNEHLKLLTEFLAEKGKNRNILFYDNIDDKRVDLNMWYEESDNEIYIAGDEGELYELHELDLIDDAVLKFK